MASDQTTLPESTGTPSLSDERERSLRAHYDALVADLFPRFAWVEAGILSLYAVLLGFSQVDIAIRVVLGALAAASAIAPPMLARGMSSETEKAAKAQEYAALCIALGLCNALPLLYLVGSTMATMAAGVTLLAAGCIVLSPPLLLAILASGVVAIAPAAVVSGSFEPLALAAAMACLGLLAHASRVQIAERLHVEREREIEREREDHARREAAIQQNNEKEREAAFDLQVRAKTEAFWSWDLLEDRVWFSPRWKAMLGYAGDDLDGEPSAWFNIVHPHDLGRLLDTLKTYIESTDEESFEIEHRIRQKDGAYCWVLSRGRAVRDDEGVAQRILGLQVNLRRLKLFESQLMHDATHDRLTGLPNRQYLLTRLREDAERAARNPEYQFAVVFLDLDGFKDVNDSLGHMTGDRLLASVGKRLAEVRGPEDTIARLGGDEFVILFRGVRGEEETIQRASQVQEALKKPFLVGPQEVSTRASIGIALSSQDVNQPEDLLRNADLAMYQVKSGQKGQIQVFDSDMHVRTTRLWGLQNDLRRAVERNELELRYQPQIDLASGRIAGAEALIRWRRGGEELVSPGEFIPLAEEQGLIWEIGEWALWAACRQNKLWQTTGLRPVKVAVNLSAKQLSNDDFSNLIKRVLRDTGLDARWLEVELTETALMGSLDATPANLYSLFCLGIQTAIDDFGTGYSSLDYLRRLHFDTLKIDRNFIADISNDSRAAALAQSMIDMAHRLQLRVVAEGVETFRQLVFLSRQGCDEIQGYLASKPVTVDEFTEMLRSDARLLDIARESADPEDLALASAPSHNNSEGLRHLARATREHRIESASIPEHNPVAGD